VLLEQEVPAGTGRMVWANMVLHLSADPVAQMAQWHRALAVDGFLMFSTFGPDTLLELRDVYQEAGWPSPHVPFVDMHDIGDQLVQQGFADPVMDQETLRLHWSSPEALVAELRGLGGNLDVQRGAGLRTPRWQRRLLDALRARAGADGRIALRFELVYGHAFKAAPRAPAGAPATVSLDQVRASLAAHRRGGKGL
jgi:malonyl-CoA O-methyltransferase